MSETLAIEFESHRAYLFSIAYRLLGSAADAEDLLQECFIQLSNYRGQSIDNLRAFLSTMVTRRGIDLLRRLQRQRTDYIGPWLPEPLAPGDEISNPELQQVQESDISLAILYAMERLQPRERAVLVLRDAFDYDYSEIAKILEIKTDYARKLASRARAAVRDARKSTHVAPAEVEALMAAFLKAARKGELAALEEMLSADAKAITDGGGQVNAAINIIHTRNHVARFILGLSRKADQLSKPVAFLQINGRPALFMPRPDGGPQLITIQIKDGRIETIFSISNPAKLKRLPEKPGWWDRLRSLWVYWQARLP